MIAFADHGSFACLPPIASSRAVSDEHFRGVDRGNSLWRLPTRIVRVGHPRPIGDLLAAPRRLAVTLSILNSGPALSVARGDAVICVPVYGAVEDLGRCLKALVSHTPRHIPILLADDSSVDPDVRRLIEEVSAVDADQRPFAYLRQQENLGFVQNMNAAFAAVPPADVVIVNSDCIVTENWFECLRAAAYSDTRIATASTLTNSGTIVSVPYRNRPIRDLPQDWALGDAAKAVRGNSLSLRPAIPTAIGHCVYIRRDALDLVGPFDEAFSPGYEEEVDFSQRCVRAGLTHVVADDVLVLHRGGASFGSSDRAVALRKTHHEIIRSRYPYFDEWVARTEGDSAGPLPRSLAAATRALTGLSVTIDARILTSFLTGTQLHVLEVIAALGRHTDVGLRVVVPADLGDYAKPLLTRLEQVEVLPAEGVDGSIEPSDVVHRPYQVSDDEDLKLLRRLGRRLVITHQDLIGYHNPTYHSDYASWDAHRRLTRAALAVADQVAFFSRHAAEDAVSAELIDRERTNVVYLGTDHQLRELRPDPVPPRGADRVGDSPFLLYLGTDFHHKNRLFAIKLMEALRAHHAWKGKLVFAGARATFGSSAGDEARYLAVRAELDQHVIDLAAVSEAGKAWLIDRAAALVYPTTFEGFGLIPFEAAEAGKPCLFAPTTSLAELLPASAGVLVPWDAEASSARAIRLLTAGEEQVRHLDILRAASARLTWRRTAERLVEVYKTAAMSSARDVARVTYDYLALEEAHYALERELEALRYHGNRIDQDLVGPKGMIPIEARRPLLAIASRRWLRALVFAPLLAFYRGGYFVRNGRLPPRFPKEQTDND